MRRAARYGGYALGIAALLIVVAAIVIPQLLDRPRLAAELQARLSKAVDGEVRWKEFSIRVFPFPRGSVRGLEVRTAAATLTTDEATATLRLWPLILGRAEISAVNVLRPAVHLTVVPAAAVPEEAQLAPPPRNPLEAYRSVMRAIVEGLREFAPNTVVEVDSAEIAVRVEGVPPIEAKDFTVRARTSEHGVEVNASAASRYWNAMKLVGRIEYADLSSTAELQLVRINGQAWLDWVLASSGVQAAVPDVDLNLRFRGDAAKALEVEVDGTAKALTLTRAGQQIAASPIVLKSRVSADAKDVALQIDKLGIGATSLSGGNVRYAPADGSVDGEIGFEIDLPQVAGYARHLVPDALASVESMTGALRGRARATLKGGNWDAEVSVAKSDARVAVNGLPGPAILTDALVRATPKAIAVKSVTASLLDSKVVGAANIDLGRALRVRGSVAGLDVGAQTIGWAWKTAALPPAAELKPLRVAVSQFAWGPKQALDLKGNVQIEGGPTVTVDVGWSPDALNLRGATIKDRMSDVSVAARVKGKLIEGKYSGTLDSRSIAAAMRSGAAVPAGMINGALAFTVDREKPRDTAATGALKAENLDLSWLAGKPAKLERMALSADADTVRIGEATLEWAGQRASLKGEVKRTAKGPIVDAQVESPGIVIDELLPKPAPKPETKEEKPSAIWPLPVTGRIGVNVRSVQYETYKVQPLRANIVLQENRAAVDVQEAFLCGFALPLTFEATPKGYAAAAQIAAQGQKLEDAAKCLSNEKVLLTGAMNLRVDISTQGQPAELVQNLKGTVNADVRNGQMMKFALIGNILSMQNVVALAQQGGPKLEAEGFPFRQLKATGQFENGRFVLKEGVFHSNAIGLGANGWISLADFQSSLTVLVAPLALLDEGVRKLPVLGYVVGGTFTSLPVAVSGDIRDPTVVPLGPRAITSELTGLVTRTFSLPGKVVDPGSR